MKDPTPGPDCTSDQVSVEADRELVQRAVERGAPNEGPDELALREFDLRKRRLTHFGKARASRARPFPEYAANRESSKPSRTRAQRARSAPIAATSNVKQETERARGKLRTPSERKEAKSAGSDFNLVRERMRSWIAFVVVGPLASVVPLALLGLLFGKLSVGDLKELFASLGLTPLVGTAMGFYFGRVAR